MGFIEDFRFLSKPINCSESRMFCGVSVELSETPDHVYLHDIYSPEAGKGNGTRALKLLTKMANRHKVKILGYAKAYSANEDHIQDQDILVSWYKKHGFAAEWKDQGEGRRIRYDPPKQT